MKKERKHEKSEEQEVRSKEQEVLKETAPKEQGKSQEELAAEYLDGWKRCQAEFENYRKRQAESQKELAGYLIEKLLQDIIPVLDNFRMATGHVPENAKDSPWVIGIQYIEKQLEDVLRSHGVEVIEVKEGDTFDPATMEAISSKTQKADKGETSKEQVVEKVLQNGYKVGNRIVRAAKVTVK